MKEGVKPTKPAKGLKKASTLKKNKQVSGLVFFTKDDCRVYYKVKLSKKTKVKFNYEVMSSDRIGLWLRIADSKGNFLGFNEKGKVDKEEITAWTNKGSDSVSLNKGTYYFVIQTASEDHGTGYYKLKLK